MVNCFWPGIFAASTNRISRFSAYCADPAFEIANARLPGIIPNDSQDGLIAECDLALPQPVFKNLSLNQVALGDMEFLLVRVSGELQDLHSVPQRPRDSIQHIGGSDEHHLAQVKGDIQVIIPEIPVLLGIQYLQQCGRGIPPPVGAKFVHLVQHDHRVLGSDPSHGLQDPARQGADISSAVAADLGFIMHPSEAHAHEFSIERPCNGLAEGCFADPRGSDKAENDPLPLAPYGVGWLRFTGPLISPLHAELPDGQILQNPIFDLLEIVVVLIQDLACVRDVQDVFG
jgi:hypothetical protein